MIPEKLEKYELILASGSPRRQSILSQMDLRFRVMTIDTDESHPGDMEGAGIARYLSRKKAEAVMVPAVTKPWILISADTVVWHKGCSLAKPDGPEEAASMLRQLSGDTHDVITGVCLRSENKIHVFHETTRVTFRQLNKQEIDHYIRVYKPLDKAGAYGIQEWIGMTGIERIEGCYFNVVGLPAARLYRELGNFLKEIPG
mgnify:FL=1